MNCYEHAFIIKQDFESQTKTSSQQIREYYRKKLREDFKN